MSYPVVKLRDILEPNFEKITVDPTSTYKFAGVYSFARGLFERGDLQGNKTSYKFFFKLHKDDVLFSKVKGWEGAIAVVDEKFEGYFLSPQYPTFKAKKELININYLQYYCKQKIVWDYLLSKSRGIGARRNSVSEEQFLSLEIPLPPLPEQKKIVERLSSLGNKIDTVWSESNKLASLRKELFKRILIDCFPSNNLTNISDVANVQRGKSKHRPRNAAELYGGPYPFIQTGDVSRANGYIESYSQTYSAMGLKQSKLWPKGTICMTIAANIADVAVLNFDSCFPDSVVGITPKAELVDGKYLYYFLRKVKSELENKASKTAQQNINLGIINTLSIPVLPFGEQRKIAMKLEKIEQELINKLEEKAMDLKSELSALFPSLLNKAFRGELI